MLTIAVDFDNTLVHEDERGEFAPVEGAAEAMRKLREAGHRVIVHSCRTTEGIARGDLHHVLHLMADVLREFDIVFDEIWAGPKMIAHIYIDDRAVAFRDDWTRALSDVEHKIRHTYSE